MDALYTNETNQYLADFADDDYSRKYLTVRILNERINKLKYIS